MFYLRLALQNIRKSLKVFIPFILASLVLYAIVCSVFLILLSPVIETMGTGAFSLGLGSIVLTIFSLIMEIYTFRFLMQQRAREFGLYHILGMNKKKIVFIATIELAVIFAILIIIGSILAGVFSNVLYLIFVYITNYHELHFSISPLAFFITTFIFSGIFFVEEM